MWDMNAELNVGVENEECILGIDVKNEWGMDARDECEECMHGMDVWNECME